jgi:hypothetical protein
MHSETYEEAKNGLGKHIANMLGTYRNTNDEGRRRDILLELRGVATAFSFTGTPALREELAKLDCLDVTEVELATLLKAYWKHYGLARFEEKTTLRKIQNCVLRMQILDRHNGHSRFLAMLDGVQQDQQLKLVLM